jgi:hypothetical protein
MSRERILPLHVIGILLHSEPVTLLFCIYLMTSDTYSKNKSDKRTHDLPVCSLVLQRSKQNCITAAYIIPGH